MNLYLMGAFRDFSVLVSLNFGKMFVSKTKDLIRNASSAAEPQSFERLNFVSKIILMMGVLRSKPSPKKMWGN